MKFKKKKIEGQSGQATAELVVSLVGILIVFTGFLMIVDIGVTKVENVIDARGEADIYGLNGTVGSSGVAIKTWSAGADGFYYTEDDQIIGGTTEDPTTFSSQLLNDSFSLVSDFSMSYVGNNFASTLDPNAVFWPAADLTSATQNATVELDGATRTVYFDASSISLSDTVYMPFMD